MGRLHEGLVDYNTALMGACSRDSHSVLQPREGSTPTRCCSHCSVRLPLGAPATGGFNSHSVPQPLEGSTPTRCCSHGRVRLPLGDAATGGFDSHSVLQPRGLIPTRCCSHGRVRLPFGYSHGRVRPRPPLVWFDSHSVLQPREGSTPTRRYSHERLTLTSHYYLR